MCIRDRVSTATFRSMEERMAVREETAMAYEMNQGGIAKRLVDFVMAILGKMPGALLVTNIGTNALFGAISEMCIRDRVQPHHAQGVPHLC